MDQVPLIAHVLYRFDVGGLENGVVNLINRIPGDRYRHAIVALSESTDFTKRLHREIPVYALHKREGKDLGLHWRFYRLFRRLKPDIVHTRNLNALEAQLPAWLAGVEGRVHGEHGWDVHDFDGSVESIVCGGGHFGRLYNIISRYRNIWPATCNRRLACPGADQLYLQRRRYRQIS